MEAGLGDVVAAGEQPVVQLLDVQQLHVELEPAHVDAALEDRVKGERVVGAGGDADAKLHDASMLSSRSRSASSAGSSDQPAAVAVAGHVRHRPQHRAAGSRTSLPPRQPRIPPSPRAPPAARPRGAIGPGRATPMRVPPKAPVRPARRAPPRRCRRTPAGPASGRRRRCRGSAPAAGASTAADRGQLGVVAPGHPGQHHPLRPVPGDRVHRAHAGPGQAEPAQLQRRVPERQPPRLELGRDEHERDRRSAHTISTIRSIAPRARAATSSGTVTGYCISRRLSRSLGRVICFM